MKEASARAEAEWQSRCAAEKEQASISAESLLSSERAAMLLQLNRTRSEFEGAVERERERSCAAQRASEASGERQQELQVGRWPHWHDSRLEQLVLDFAWPKALSIQVLNPAFCWSLNT